MAGSKKARTKKRSAARRWFFWQSSNRKASTFISGDFLKIVERDTMGDCHTPPWGVFFENNC